MNKDVLNQNLALLVGQDQAKHLLTKCLMADNCSAYLLVGPPHVGKGFLARLLASSWHSETNLSKIHPDTVIFDDLLAKNSGDNNENQWKQSVDDFVHSIYLSPVVSPKKVGIVEDIDRFSLSALNALLKTLEEPPARAVLILTAQEITHILPTILSRAQIVRLHYLSDNEVADYLHQHQAEHIAEITTLANGAIGMAHRLMNDIKLLEQVLEQIKDYEHWLQKDIPQMLRMANIKDRDTAIDLVSLWLNTTHRLLLDKLNYTESNLLKNIALKYSEADLVTLLDQLKSALADLEANANTRITLESTLLSVV